MVAVRDDVEWLKVAIALPKHLNEPRKTEEKLTSVGVAMRAMAGRSTG